MLVTSGSWNTIGYVTLPYYIGIASRPTKVAIMFNCFCMVFDLISLLSLGLLNLRQTEFIQENHNQTLGNLNSSFPPHISSTLNFANLSIMTIFRAKNVQKALTAAYLHHTLPCLVYHSWLLTS